jgi:signal transduction histidine kinase
MDTLTVAFAVIAGAAVLVCIIFFVRARRHVRAVSGALVRIAGSDPGWRSRIAALDEALERLERSSGQAQRERAQLAGAVQSAPLGIVITDDEGVVVTANPAAGRFLGARLGQAVAEVRIREAIEKAILDVSEERRVAAMRRDFIANVGHELKTPLGALAALAETLAATVEGDATSARLAGRLEAESNRLSRLVGDILDLSQAEAMAAHEDPVVMADVVADVVAELGEVAATRSVEIVVVEPIDPRLRVVGDGRQLRTLVSNLVDNAIKYSFPEDDEEPPVVTIHATEQGDSLVIEVADEGIGIPESHIERVFERFYRVDRARSRETGGTGLGLSIARHIARNHNGDVAVESSEGEGSRFRVTLPLWRPRT